MTYLLIAALLTIAVLAFTFLIRAKDLPPPPAESPTRHLEARRAQIYENLRDLHFEFRVGKLSDEDYQRTKTELQSELAAVLSEIDAAGAKPQAAPAKAKAIPQNKCPHCGATFEKALKFCGECGKAMTA